MKIALYIAALLTVLLTGAAGAAGTSLPDDDVSSEDVRAAAAELFAERFPLQARHMQVRVERMGSRARSASAAQASAAKSSAGNDSAGGAPAPQSSPLRIRLTQSDAIPKGHTQVRLLTESPGGRWSESGWALLYVAHYDSIAIAQRDLSKNDPVGGSDFSFAWMETTTYRGEPLTPDHYRALAAGGLFAARPIRSGESVRVDDVRPPFAVDTGETLTMTYERNGIILKVTCQAREPGVAGDVIRAYNPDTKTTYKVELTGPRAAGWISTL